MGKHSGRHAFKDKLNDLGYTDVTDDVVQAAFGKFKILADKKKHIYDEDIVALVDDSLIIDNKINAINLKSLKVFAGTGEPQRADMMKDQGIELLLILTMRVKEGKICLLIRLPYNRTIVIKEVDI